MSVELADLVSVRAEQPGLVPYTELWLAGKVPNQPIREDTTTMKLELGSPSFKEAASVWQALKSFY